MKKVIVLGAPADQGIPLLTALKARGLEPTAGVRRPGAMAAITHNSTMPAGSVTSAPRPRVSTVAPTSTTPITPAAQA